MWSKEPHLLSQSSNKSTNSTSQISNTTQTQITVLNKLHKGRATVVEITSKEAEANGSHNNMSSLKTNKRVAVVINQSTRGLSRNHRTSTPNNNTSNTIITTLRTTTMLKLPTTSNKHTMAGHKITTIMDRSNTTKKCRFSSSIRGK